VVDTRPPLPVVAAEIHLEERRQNPMSTEENKAIVRRFLEEISARSWKAGPTGTHWACCGRSAPFLRLVGRPEVNPPEKRQSPTG
jgi:hypothetical protein